MVEGSNLGDLAAGIALATRPITTLATILTSHPEGRPLRTLLAFSCNHVAVRGG